MKMPKKKTEETNTKQGFNLLDYKKNKSINFRIKEKDLSWIPMSDAFFDALRIPGVPRGFFTSFRGYSNTGKSTAIYELVKGCQQTGDLAVIIDTESNWNWEHARNIGVKFAEVVNEDGDIDYEGDFLFFNGQALIDMYATYDHSSSKGGTKKLRNEPVIEDIAKLMNELLDDQDEGKLPRNLCFMWDSVGSINSFRSATSKTSNNQWNAGAMESAFKSLVNHRIPSSRSETSQYTNTLAVVQKIWLDNENKVVKHKGGEAFFYAPRLIIHYGGILTHSTEKLKAISNGETYQFGIQTRIRCEKNQVNGIEEHGVIASTSHGYWNPDKIDDYKKVYRDFILKKLNSTADDFVIERERVEDISYEDRNG